MAEDNKKRQESNSSVVEAVKVTSSKRRSVDSKDKNDLVTVWLLPPFSTLFVYLTKKEEISNEVHYQTWLAFGYAIGSIVISIILSIIGGVLFLVPGVWTIVSVANWIIELAYLAMWFYSLYLIIQKNEVWDGFIPQIADWARDQAKKN